MSAVEIRVGQVWRSRDKRDNGRTVVVEETCGPWDNGFIVVKGWRKSSIRRMNFTRLYEFVSDPGADK